jgi:hypothetical protein
MAFMHHMFEAYVKANKKAGKSNKHKKRNYDSSDRSDGEKETGYSNTGFNVDKHLKVDILLLLSICPLSPVQSKSSIQPLVKT